MEFIESGATIFVMIVVFVLSFVIGLSVIDVYRTKEKEPKEKSADQSNPN